MTKLLVSKSLRLTAARSCRAGSTGTFSLARTACIIFAFCAAAANASPAQTFTTLASFDGTNGAGPSTGLVQGANGNFYGTTSYDGTNEAGTIFEVTPAGTLTTLYNFCSQPSCSDGFSAGPLLLATNGNFYGITGSWGTIYKISPAGQFATIYSFCPLMNCEERALPGGTLVQARNGDFYGVTGHAGANGAGTVFEVTAKGELTTLHTFDFTDGSDPSGLVLATNGNIYGTTFGDADQIGCTQGCGTVFEMTPAGKLTTIYTFCSQTNCADGVGPSSLLQARNGSLYGVTYGGVRNPGCPPNYGCGTVFEMTPAGKLTTIYTFCAQLNCADGTNAFGLLQATNGNFYGTADSFSSNNGTAFELTPRGELTTIYNFCSQTGCTDGADPIAGVLQGTNGILYGTTAVGGTDNDGVVFSLSVDLGPFVETTPTSGKIGAKVLVLGNDLKGATGVTFNGVDATITGDSNTAITATVPTGATTGVVEVTTVAGKKLVSNLAFQVIP